MTHYYMHEMWRMKRDRMLTSRIPFRMYHSACTMQQAYSSNNSSNNRRWRQSGRRHTFWLISANNSLTNSQRRIIILTEAHVHSGHAHGKSCWGIEIHVSDLFYVINAISKSPSKFWKKWKKETLPTLEYYIITYNHHSFYLVDFILTYHV